MPSKTVGSGSGGNGNQNRAVGEVRAGGSNANGGGFLGGAYVARPAAVAVTATAGGAVAVGTYYVVVTLRDYTGETGFSPETAVTTSAGLQTLTINPPTAPLNPHGDPEVGDGWYVYVGTQSGGPYFLQYNALFPNGYPFGTPRSLTTTPVTTSNQPPGTDYSLQDNFQLQRFDFVIDPGDGYHITSPTYNFTAQDVGNYIKFQDPPTPAVNWIGGIDGAGGAYLFTPANVVGSGPNAGLCVGTMGGALASPNQVMIDGGSLFVFIKYNAAAFANVSIGDNGGRKWIGYDTHRKAFNIDANRPTLKAGANNMTMFLLQTTDNIMIRNVILDANGHTGVIGINLNQPMAGAFFIKAVACDTAIVCTANGTFVEECEANACTSVNFNLAGSGTSAVRCTATDLPALGSAVGFGLTGAGGCVEHCAIHSASNALGGGKGNTGVQVGTFAVSSKLINISIYNCGRGVVQATTPPSLWDNIVVAKSGYMDFDMTVSGTVGRLVRCAGTGEGTQGFFGTPVTVIYEEQLINFTYLTASPFLDPANKNLTLNTDPGGGLLLRDTGVPGELPGLAGLSYVDVGAFEAPSAIVPGPSTPIPLVPRDPRASLRTQRALMRLTAAHFPGQPASLSALPTNMPRSPGETAGGNVTRRQQRAFQNLADEQREA